MKKIQKLAWGFVVIIPISVLLSVICTMILYYKIGWPKASLGLAFLGLIGFAGAAPMFFKKDSGAVESDERDLLIAKNAVLAGFIASYCVTGFACMTPMVFLGANAKIKVTWLPLIFIAVFVSYFFAYSVAILTQYGREEKGKNQ